MDETDEATIVAAETLRPEGISAEEWELVRIHRARKAEEARRIMAWRAPLADLDEACGDAGVHAAGEEAWDRAAARFIERATAHGWQADDEVEGFTRALMRAAGYAEVAVRGHGTVWERS
jgi:hypothetical protein